MANRRLELHQKLLKYTRYVYFQPPADHRLNYPCIVYNKNTNNTSWANNDPYSIHQGYQLLVIDKDPDSTIAEDILKDFDYVAIASYYVSDRLNHTVLNIYY